MSEKKKERNFTVLDSKKNKVEIPFHECDHCNQLIPNVGDCKDCGVFALHL
ncbi:MAG TPA: hypothetical protein VMW53_01165 [archaeon]|nr:hypothetical protein [archaeon]